ncbi:MAG: hypothetical protein SCM96_15500 [Acidobacteriota bacterium]|nr:hypothetical protein [Acidobacteriota bacterium]
MVFDKGCNSPENIARIDANPWMSFIGTQSTYHHPDLCQVPLTEYKEMEGENEPGGDMLRMNQIDQIKELQRQGLGPQEIAGRLR